MDEIINGLHIHEVLYVTREGTPYKLIKILPDNSISYSIKANSKTLAYATIKAAAIAALDGIAIDAAWYANYSLHEYISRPCNLKVLQELINRLIGRKNKT